MCFSLISNTSNTAAAPASTAATTALYSQRRLSARQALCRHTIKTEEEEVKKTGNIGSKHGVFESVLGALLGCVMAAVGGLCVPP